MSGDSAQQPLLEDLDDSADGAGPKVDSKDINWATELIDLLKLAAPACLQLCAQQGLVVASQALVGHIGPDALAAASIGITWFNLIFYILLGVTSALDTLGAQAYGANDRTAVVVWGWCSAIVLGGLSAVMALAMWISPLVAVHFFRQPHHIAEMVGTYCRYMIPSLWPFVWAITIMKVMQAQNVMWFPALATAFVCVANVGITWGLIVLYGFQGAAAATSVSRTLLFLIVAAYALIVGTSRLDERGVVEDGAVSEESSPLKGAHHGRLATVEEEESMFKLAWTAAQPRLLWRFLQLGMPGAIMMSADASSFDVTTALAGMLSTVAVDAHTIMLTLCVFVFISFPFGVATASTIRVGNLLGAGQAQLARASGILCIGTGTLFLSLAGVAIYALRWRIGSWFVEDAEVQAAVASIAPIAALYQFPDGILGTAGGVLRGMGRQSAIMIFNLAGFWGTGVPCGYIFTFKLHRGIVGLWWGIFTGVCVTATLCVIALCMTDWDAEVKRAKQWAAEEAQEAEALNAAVDSAVAGTTPAGGDGPACLPRPSSAVSLHRASITPNMPMGRSPLQRPSFFSHTNAAHGLSYPSSLLHGSSGSLTHGGLLTARVRGSRDSLVHGSRDSLV
ncbi:hypothetical protein WJX73_005380 [Symbiochloris irregularis]|uniref:Protein DETOXIFICATION n=1 Tax=Symbiochloris irregularis TaxID=706552 RepID=A0AAW1NRN3_9CHLO